MEVGNLAHFESISNRYPWLYFLDEVQVTFDPVGNISLQKAAILFVELHIHGCSVPSPSLSLQRHGTPFQRTHTVAAAECPLLRHFH